MHFVRRTADRWAPTPRFAAGGDWIPVDLAVLITAVYVAPEAKPWFAELAKAVVRRYGFQFSVVQSDLDRDPCFEITFLAGRLLDGNAFPNEIRALNQYGETVAS